jgi:hypothetical protein
MNQKLDVGNVLTRTFETYRDQFTLLIPAALVLFVPVAIVNGLILTGGGLFPTLLVWVISLLATYFFQGMVVEAVRDILDGRRDHSVGSLFASVTPVMAPLFGAGFIYAIATGIGLLLLIVPGLFLLTIWAVLAPVIVVERPAVFNAFERSRQLVKGHGWQVFGVIVVLFLITVAASLVVAAIFVAIADSFVGYFLSEAITRVLVSPLSAIAAAVMFFELKARHGEPVPEMGAAAAPTGVAPGTPAPAPPAGQPAPGAPPAGQPGPTPPPPGPEQPPGPGPERPA